MDTILRQKIINKLTSFLNREPTEDEIVNGQSDTNLMGWIRDDDQKILQEKIDSLLKI